MQRHCDVFTKLRAFDLPERRIIFQAFDTIVRSSSAEVGQTYMHFVVLLPKLFFGNWNAQCFTTTSRGVFCRGNLPVDVWLNLKSHRLWWEDQTNVRQGTLLVVTTVSVKLLEWTCQHTCHPLRKPGKATPKLTCIGDRHLAEKQNGCRIGKEHSALLWPTETLHHGRWLTHLPIFDSIIRFQQWLCQSFCPCVQKCCSSTKLRMFWVFFELIPELIFFFFPNSAS